MKMISNDLRSSCRALLLGAYQDSAGGGTHYDSIFHDIIDNSKVIGTVFIDDTYKFTLNFWEDNILRINRDCGSLSLGGSDSETVGYDQSIIYPLYNYLHIARILWRGNAPIYAALDGKYSLNFSYHNIAIYDDMDDHTKYRKCVYPGYVDKYVKDSVESLGNFNITPTFSTSYKCLAPPTKVKIDDGSGSSSFYCKFKYTRKSYDAEFGKCEWTKPETGEIITISDMTKPPKIVLSSTSELSGSISISSDMWIIPRCDDNYIGIGVFSDMSNAELDAETDMLLKAICEKYGDESCYTHVKPQILVPETEEST